MNWFISRNALIVVFSRYGCQGIKQYYYYTSPCCFALQGDREGRQLTVAQWPSRCEWFSSPVLSLLLKVTNWSIVSVFTESDKHV